MLVPQTIKLCIITAQGKRCHLPVESTAGIHFIKRRAIEALYASECAGQEPQAVKKALYFKLIHPATIRTLKDEATLFDEQITKDCDLLLVKKRLDESRFSRYGAAASRDKTVSKAPDAARIKEATAKLPKRGTVRKQRETVSAEEFQRDLKRILVTLVESAQNILALNSEAAKIFKEAQEIMSQESTTNTTVEPGIPDETLVQLTDMGFSRERATLALKRCRFARLTDPDSLKSMRGMSVHAAMEWLLLHPEAERETDQSEPTAEPASPALTPDADQSAVTEPQAAEPDVGAVGAEADVRPKTTSSLSANVEQSATSPIKSKDSGARRQSRAQTILESFRAYKRRKFKPNVVAMNSLIDMGFEQSDVLEALRVTDNNKEQACDWLLGDRRNETSVDTLEDGIEPSSPLYQSIITNPVVQLGLSNPRCLLAFLHMLENGANAMDWLKDPDVGPILLQISRIYTAEKSDCVFPGFSDG